jgi:hypothetical protein
MTVLKRYELARVFSPTTGTGSPLTLGAAVPGYRTYADAGVINGDLVPYCIRDGVASELGSGIYSSTGPTLTRNVIASTNFNNPINLSGLAEVFIGPRAADFGTGANQALLLDDTGKIPAVDGTQITGVIKKAGDTMNGTLTMGGTTTPTIQFTPTAGATTIATLYQSANALTFGTSGVSNNVVINLVNGETTFAFPVTLPSSNPTLVDHATRKAYVDTKVPFTGGTMTGQLRLVGTGTNDNAASGIVGEFVETISGNIGISANTWTAVASRTMAAGDWDISGAIHIVGTVTANSAFYISLNSTAATINLTHGFVQNGIVPSSADIYAILPPRRLSLSAAQNWFLNFICFAACTVTGSVYARRIR